VVRIGGCDLGAAAIVDGMNRTIDHRIRTDIGTSTMHDVSKYHTLNMSVGHQDRTDREVIGLFLWKHLFFIYLIGSPDTLLYNLIGMMYRPAVSRIARV
jgi:hypothetical protein